MLDSLPKVNGPAIHMNIQGNFHRYLEILYTEAGKATPNFKTFGSKVIHRNIFTKAKNQMKSLRSKYKCQILTQ